MSVKDFIKSSIIGLAIFTSGNALSEERNLAYGFAIKSGVFDIDDPDGKTESPIFLVPQFTMSYALNRTVRLRSGFEYWKGEFSSGDGRIAQDMEGYGVFSEIEKSINIIYGLDLHLGAIASYKELNFKHREMLDDQAYLVASFNDRSTGYGSLAINSVMRFKLGERMDLEVGVLSEISDVSQFTGVTFGIGF